MKLKQLFRCVAFLAFCLLNYQNMQAQTFSFWPFGSGAIDFSTDPPTIDKKYYDNHTGGPMLSISDSTGKLLFYADRALIFNRFNKILDSCGYLHLVNPRQGMVAFPSLQNPGNYIFVFCGEKTHGRVDLDWENGDVLTLGYYEIDPKLDNDSGNVTHKQFYNILKKPFSKITLVKQEKSKGYWLIGRYLENLYAFPYTKNGFGAPVITKIGSATLQGNLKASHDGKYFVECGYNTILHYDFDLQTGKFSNVEIIDNIGKYFAYDVAFSPNDSLFYVIDYRKSSCIVNIIQYQRYSKNHSASKKQLLLRELTLFKGVNGKDTFLAYGHEFGSISGISGIQLAPNGKMYFVCAPNAYKNNGEQTYLGEITYPNRIGYDCKINPRAYPFYLYKGLTGLPFAMYDPGKFPLFSYILTCDKIVLKNESYKDFKKFTWYFGDGDSAYKTDFSAVEHQYKNNGKFHVRLKAEMPDGYIAWFSDSVNFNPNSINDVDFSATDSISCQYTASQFRAEIIKDTVNEKTGATFTWDFGDGTPEVTIKNDSTAKHIYTKTGTFKVTLAYYNGFCRKTMVKDKAIEIIPAPKPAFSVSQTEGCAPLTVQITNNAEGNIVKSWYDLGNGTLDSSENPSAIYAIPGKYFITQNLISQNGCHTQDSILITIHKGFSANDSISILNASVDSGKVHLYWQKNNFSKSYNIFRRAASEEAFSPIETVSDTNFYEDKTAEVQSFSYVYKIEAEDSCGKLLQKGRTAQTILLQAEEVDNKYILLSWNAYAGWPAGVKEYSLFSHPNNAEWKWLANSRTTYYNDENYANSSPAQDCYYVQAFSRNDTLQSFSNTLCLPLKPVFWIPNAFTPNNDNVNDSFKVKAIGISGFEMYIFNRWNVNIFNSDDLNEGWDGKYKGKPMPLDAYVYVIKALTKDGWIYKRGFFSLMQ